MMIYAQNLNCEGIQFLMQSGANINVVDSFGRNMLHYLVQNDESGQGTEWLLKSYGDVIDVDGKTTAGVTPMMLAAKANHSKAVEALLNGKANPFTSDQLGQDAADYTIATKAKKGQSPLNEMILKAKKQWLEQVTMEQIEAEQPKKDEFFDQFK